MKMTRITTASLLMAVLASTLAGCAKEKPLPPPTPTAEEIAAQQREERGKQSLMEGIRLYQGGNYFMAENKFLAPEIWEASTGTQLQALKYLAFSYCVTERNAQCRYAFERALQIDPSFRLDSAEDGHPQWGPAFQQASERPVKPSHP